MSELQQGYAESFPLPPILPPEETDTLNEREMPSRNGVQITVVFNHGGKSNLQTAFVEILDGYDAFKAAHRCLDEALKKYVPKMPE